MLQLPIKKKWYDMILSGEKTEEYREIGKYYDVRFGNVVGMGFITHWSEVEKRFRNHPEGIGFKGIVLKNGYAFDARAMMISGKIRIGTGRPEWGAEPGKEYYVLSIEEKRGPFGERL